jgi:CheY-like chemotaxis protein
VLVVDDDATFRELAIRLLGGPGYRVVDEAGNVAEALVPADKLRPDAVLADIGLPDGDGFSLTRQLRLRPWKSGRGESNPIFGIATPHSASASRLLSTAVTPHDAHQEPAAPSATRAGLPGVRRRSVTLR